MRGLIRSLINLIRGIIEIFRREDSSASLNRDSSGMYRVTDSSGKSIFVSHPRRLSQYQKGIDVRLERLRNEYCLSKEILASGPIVDVGANVGELFFLAQQEGSEYFAFEPDPSAFKALTANVTDSSLFPIALSNTEGEIPFGLATSGADSSLLIANSPAASETIVVKTARLDDFAEKYDFPKRVGLLKIEAEGNEPEVLEGAEQFLERVLHLVVDAGPERFGRSTAPEVVNFLLQRGFQLEDVFLKRGTFLFRKVRALP